MHVPLRSVSLALALALWTSTALAQQELRQEVLSFAPLGGGDSTRLLQQESVQKALKLTPEQIKKVEDLSEEMRAKFQQAFGGREEGQGDRKIIIVDRDNEEHRKKMQELHQETEKAVAKILKPEQFKRLKQISYQQQGGRAFTDPEVAKALRLTEEQQKKIREINEDAGSQIGPITVTIEEDPAQKMAEHQKKMAEVQKASTDKIMKLLTAAQKMKWKELQGEPFKGTLLFEPPGPPPE
jgi:Spy/CpxP family protein refolding chaperone